MVQKQMARVLGGFLTTYIVERPGQRVLYSCKKWKCHQIILQKPYASYFRRFCTQANLQEAKDDVTVYYHHGLPVITVPLPSRRERCRFTLRPVTSTVGDFLKDIQREDHGVDRILIQATDGIRIASSTSIGLLMQKDFCLILNDIMYHVCPPEVDMLASEQIETLSDVKVKVSQLYEALNVDEHQLEMERKLVGELEKLKQELEPLEKKKEEMLVSAQRQSTVLSWVGLGLMGIQFGILARLTWWEYSWDIMEPVTYFITYGTTIAMYGYFVLTRNEYLLPDVYDRQALFAFYKNSRKQNLDIGRYNSLKNAISQVENDLRRLRDPLQLHLPIRSKERNSEQEGSNR